MTGFFDNLFASDGMFREFVASRSQSMKGFSDEEKSLLLRQYYSVPFREYYRRRIMFLARKESAAAPCCA